MLSKIHKSPLLRLPPELISEIFLSYKHILDPFSTFSDGTNDFFQTASDPISPIPKPSNFTTHALLLLGSISRSLRNTAWATPQLWTHIILGLSHDPACLTSQIAGLTAWLARSGGCPLYIHLQCLYVLRDLGFSLEEATCRPWAHDPPFAALDAIIAHCARWEEVCLVLPHECYARLPQNPNKTTMPMLKRLTLLFQNQWFMPQTEPEDRPDWTPFLPAPSLTQVSLLNFPCRSLTPVLPLGQVTRFRGHHLDLADALDVLQRAPLLEDCTLTWALGYPPVLAPLVHPRLRTLTLEGSVSALKHLTLPALESLRLKTRRVFTGQQCVQFLQRSAAATAACAAPDTGCRLTLLHICVDFIPATALLECLEVAPALRELKVLNRSDRIHSVFATTVIQRLTLRDGKPGLVPRLQRLDVLGCSCQFDIGALGEMLEARWGGGTTPTRRNRNWGRLEWFSLEASLAAPVTIWEDIMYSPRIMELTKQGMKIRVIV